MQKFTPFVVFIICFMVVANISVKAQQSYNWVKGIGGAAQDKVMDIVSSTGPYMYACGNFTSASIQLGNQTLTNSGDNDIFVAKYDLNGNVIWAKKFGGGGPDNVVAIAKDYSDNIYITGKCNSNAPFGSIPFMGTNFIAKINSNGEVIQVIEPVSAGVNIRDIGVDSSGNMVICGDITGASYIGGNYFAAAGYADGFVAKYNTTGTFMWAKQIYNISFSGSSAGDDFCNAVAVSPNGRISVGGSANYSPQKLIITTGTTIDSVFMTSFFPVSPSFPYYFGTMGFVIQWDANGRLIWVKDLPGSGRSATSVVSLATNANNELFVGSESMSTSRATIPDTWSYVRMTKYSNTGVTIWSPDVASFYRLSVAPWLATNIRVAVYGTKAYISYRNIDGYSQSTIACINDLNTYVSVVEWSSVPTSSGVEINALAVKGNVYAGGSINYPPYTFANISPVNYGGTDGFIAKLNGPPFTPLSFSQNIPNQTICAPNGASLVSGNFTTGGLPPYQYRWSPASTLNNATSANPIATPTTTTTYTLTVTDNDGAQLKDTVTVTVAPEVPTPTITPNRSLTICPGDTVILNSSPAFTYLWNNGATTQSIKVAQAGSYWLKTNNGGICNSLAAAAATVSLYPAPVTPIITQSGNTLIASTTTGNQWYVNGVPISDGTDQAFPYNTAGIYTVTSTNSNGCRSTSAPYNAPVMIINPNGNDSLFSFSQRITPNPATQQATIRYELNNLSTVSVYVVNNQREPIATLVNQQQQKAGVYTYPVNQNGKALRKGNYYVVYVINGKRRVESMVVL